MTNNLTPGIILCGDAFITDAEWASIEQAQTNQRVSHLIKTPFFKEYKKINTITHGRRVFEVERRIAAEKSFERKWGYCCFHCNEVIKDRTDDT